MITVRLCVDEISLKRVETFGGKRFVAIFFSDTPARKSQLFATTRWSEETVKAKIDAFSHCPEVVSHPSSFLHLERAGFFYACTLVRSTLYATFHNVRWSRFKITAFTQVSFHDSPLV